MTSPGACSCITSPGEVATGVQGSARVPSAAPRASQGPCWQLALAIGTLGSLGEHFPCWLPWDWLLWLCTPAPLTEHGGDVFLVCCFPQAVILLSKGLPLCS